MVSSLYVCYRFREKYHPDVRLNPEINVKLCKRRLEIFMELHSRGAFSDVVLHSGNEASVIKLLDTGKVLMTKGRILFIFITVRFDLLDYHQFCVIQLFDCSPLQLPIFCHLHEALITIFIDVVHLSVCTNMCAHLVSPEPRREDRVTKRGKRNISTEFIARIRSSRFLIHLVNYSLSSIIPL